MSIIINKFSKKYTINDADYYTLKAPLTYGGSIALKSYVMAVDLENVTENNTKIYIDDGNQSFPVLVPLGRYDYEQLRAIIESSLNATTAGTFSVVFANGRYIITSSIDVSYKKFNEARSLWEMMGIEIDGQPTQQAGGGVVNINATNYIHISSYDMTRDERKTDSGTSFNNNIIASIRAVNNGLLHDDKDPEAPASVKAQLLSGEFNNFKFINVNTNKTLINIKLSMRDDEGYDIIDKINYSLEFVIV